MNWYDTNTAMVYTEHGLKQCGFPLDADVLHLAGIFPVSYPYPSFDERLYTFEPSGEPHPDEDGTGYVQDFAVVQLPLETAKANIKAVITQKRWQVETGGVTLSDGTRILTSIDDQNRIATALQGTSSAGIAEVDFKGADGWIKLSREMLENVAGIVAAHVQACFSRERKLHEFVDAAENVAELETVDISSDWPGQ